MLWRLLEMVGVVVGLCKIRLLQAWQWRWLLNSPRRGEQRLAQAFSRKWSPRQLAQFRASERLAQARQVSPKRERVLALVPDSRTLA